MPSKAVLDVLRICFNIPSSKFGPLELYFVRSQNKILVKQLCKSLRIKCAWAILQAFSIVLTITELHYFLSKSGLKHLLTILYHAFLLTSKIGSAVYLCYFTFRVSVILQFFNCLCQKPKGVVSSSYSQLKRQKDKFLLILLLSCVINTFLFFLILIPLVVFVTPCLHENPLTLMLIRFPCTSTPFRIVVSVVQTILMVPLFITSSTVASTILTTLSEISDNFEKLR